LSSIQPTFELEYILENNTKYKGSSILLQVVRKYVGDAIQKRIDIIQEIWELAQSIASVSSRIQNFKEYLQKDLENDEWFFKEVENTFSIKVSSLNESQRKEQKLPSPYRMKQINGCWRRRIKELREMINEIDVLRNKKMIYFLNSLI
jgi:hypothetical protein